MGQAASRRREGENLPAQTSARGGGNRSGLTDSNSCRRQVRKEKRDSVAEGDKAARARGLPRTGPGVR